MTSQVVSTNQFACSQARDTEEFKLLTAKLIIVNTIQEDNNAEVPTIEITISGSIKCQMKLENKVTILRMHNAINTNVAGTLTNWGITAISCTYSLYVLPSLTKGTVVLLVFKNLATNAPRPSTTAVNLALASLVMVQDFLAQKIKAEGESEFIGSWLVPGKTVFAKTWKMFLNEEDTETHTLTYSSDKDLVWLPFRKSTN